jgi:hypothetical protein
VGSSGKTENEVVRYMKSIGMDVITNAGFNFRSMLILLGFSTGTGRGSSTHLVTKISQNEGPPPPPAVPDGPLRIRGKQRPPLTPAQAAGNLRKQ